MGEKITYYFELRDCDERFSFVSDDKSDCVVGRLNRIYKEHLQTVYLESGIEEDIPFITLFDR